MNTPDLTSTTVINELWDGAPKVSVRHRDLPMRVQIDPDVKVFELTAALAYSGFTLRTNHETGDLFLTYAKGAK